MPEDRKDQEGQDEDFEPLDRFFAPIEDVDFPEEGAGEGVEAGTPGSPAPEDEILPPDIPEDPLAGVEAEAASAPGEATSELEGESWEELRLDVGSTQEGPGGAGPAPTGDELLAPETGHELSLDDLKSAPPEYADLPGPRDEDEQRAGDQPAPDQEEEEATVGSMASEGDEPEIGEVEAAADHIAESFREEPGTAPSGGPADLPPSPEEVEQDLLADLGKEPAQPPPVSVGVTDTLTGPSWQEPGSQEVSVAPQAPRTGRNLPLAFLSGIILVLIGIGAVAWGKAPFTVVAGAVIVMAQGELYAALHRRGYQPATALGLVFGGLIAAAAYLRGESGSLAMFALGTVFTFLWFMAIPAKSRHNTLANIAATILPLAYVPLLGGYVLVTLALEPGGRTLMLSVIGLSVGYDIAAFAIGSLWGDRALAPSISPRKSWEGAFGATLILLLVSLGILASLDPIGTLGRAVGLALVVSVAAPLGDLAESLLKRDLGVKDMGSLLPGHGGILDRVDSILFAAPAAFYFFKLVLF